VTKALQDVEKHLNPSRIFTDAAVVWASYCLRSNTGPTLRKGLEIAAAMVEYEDLIVSRASAANSEEAAQ
jgi:hypothetical protein